MDGQKFQEKDYPQDGGPPGWSTFLWGLCHHHRAAQWLRPVERKAAQVWEEKGLSLYTGQRVDFRVWSGREAANF